MSKVFYSITVFPDKSVNGYTLKNKYKDDKNAVLKLKEIRNDFDLVIIRKNEDDGYGMISSGPFITWDRNLHRLTAHGKGNPYSPHKDWFEADIDPMFFDDENLVYPEDIIHLYRDQVGRYADRFSKGQITLADFSKLVNESLKNQEKALMNFQIRYNDMLLKSKEANNE